MPLPLPALIDQLKAAAESTRLRLLAACATSELTVSDLTRIVGQSQPRVSRHLKILCDAGLLLRFRERHFVYYRVPPAGVARRLVASVLATLDADDPTIGQDLALLETVLDQRAERAQAVLAAAGSDLTLDDSGLSEERVNEEVLRLADLERVGDLLDIGTGTGRLLKLFGPYARSATGIDISADMLLVARSNLHAAGLGSVLVRHGDMYRLPFPDATFDTVTVDQVLQHADRPAGVLAEVARILKPGGQLVLIDVERGAAGGAAASEELADWTDAAGFTLRGRERLPGDALTVVISVVSRAPHSADDEAA